MEGSGEGEARGRIVNFNSFFNKPGRSRVIQASKQNIMFYFINYSCFKFLNSQLKIKF